jgi:hypothetical protein
LHEKIGKFEKKNKNKKLNTCQVWIGPKKQILWTIGFGKLQKTKEKKEV